jgi:hypothetical protein
MTLDGSITDTDLSIAAHVRGDSVTRQVSQGVAKIVADAAVVYTGSTIPVAGPRMISWPPGAT